MSDFLWRVDRRLMQFAARWPLSLLAVCLLSMYALGQDTVPGPHPQQPVSMGVELVRSMPQILESSGTVIAAVGSTATAIVSAFILVQNRKNGRLVQNSIEETKAGNAKLDVVHDAVNSQQSRRDAEAAELTADTVKATKTAADVATAAALQASVASTEAAKTQADRIAELERQIGELHNRLSSGTNDVQRTDS